MKGKELFWIDGTNKTIQRANNEAQSDITFDADTLDPTVDLEIDWINDDIYWVNHKRGTIYKASLLE